MPRISARPTFRAGLRTTSHALLVRAPDATHLFEGLDLDAPGRRPAGAVVTAAISRTAASVSPISTPATCSARSGKTPLYLGQPLALLIFEHVRRFRPGAAGACATQLREFGAETGPVAGRNYGAFRFTRVAGRRRTRRMSTRRFRKAGSVPGKFRNRRPSDLGAAADRDGRPTPRARPTARKSAPISARTIRTCLCSSAIRDAIGRSDVP